MLLRPFNEDPNVICRACAFVHTHDIRPVTSYCVDIHSDDRPTVNLTTFGDPPFPHLHRTCRMCGFVWLEETAASETFVGRDVRQEVLPPEDDDDED